jgi:hypothetical protein
MSRRVGISFLSLVCVFLTVNTADAQVRRKAEPKQTERAAPAPSLDKHDSVVSAPGPYNGKPYWLGLAQCGGIYFKLNTLYADIAAHARVVKPDPREVTEYTKKLNDAIKTATLYFTGAERFLIADRGLERVDAVLIYNEQSLAAGNRVKTIDAALNAAKACPALYQTCHEAYPKACGEAQIPIS